jgi:hypothetical protein
MDHDRDDHNESNQPPDENHPAAHQIHMPAGHRVVPTVSSAHFFTSS